MPTSKYKLNWRKPATKLNAKLQLTAISVVFLIAIFTWLGLATLQKVRAYQTILTSNSEQNLLLIELVKTIELGIRLKQNTPRHRIDRINADIVEKIKKTRELELSIGSFRENNWLSLGSDQSNVEALGIPSDVMDAFSEIAALLTAQFGQLDINTISYIRPGELSIIQRASWVSIFKQRTEALTQQLRFWSRAHYFSTIIYAALLLAFIILVSVFVLKPSIKALVDTTIKQAKNTKLQLSLAQFIQEFLSINTDASTSTDWLSKLNTMRLAYPEMRNMTFSMSNIALDSEEQTKRNFKSTIALLGTENTYLAIATPDEQQDLTGALVPFLNVLTLGSKLIEEQNLRERVELDRDQSVRLSWAITEASHNPIILFSNSFTIVAANQAACDFLDVREIDLIGKHCKILAGLHAKFSANTPSAQIAHNFFTAGIDNSIVFNYADNRSVEWRRVSTTGLGGLFSAFDITEFLSGLKLEETKNRLEIIGRISGTISHDTNNFLATVFAALELVLTDENISESNRALLTTAFRSCENAAHINKNLLNYSAKQDLIPSKFEATEIVGELRKYIAARSDNTELTYTHTGEVYIYADKVFLINALQNILQNSLAVLNGHGCIEFSVANIDPQTVRLRLCDNGPGFSNEALEFGLLPYFSQSELGSGLGLASVEGFARQSGGKAIIHNLNGGCVDMLLPAGDKTSTDNNTHYTKSQNAIASSVPTILIVEDNSGLLAVLKEWLNRINWQVVCASSLSEALEAVENNPAFDVILADVRLQDGSGLTALDAAAEHSGNSRLIAMSGFGDVRLFEKREYELLFIKKPFVWSQLASLIE